MTRADARRQVLEAHGAGPTTIEQVLAYSETACAAYRDPAGTDGAPERPERPSFPLPDESHLAVWTQYADEACVKGAIPALASRFVQLRFPIREGMSHEPAYLAATRKGQADAAEPFAPGLVLKRLDGVDLQICGTIAGRIPVLVVEERDDFVALVQAFTERNEPAAVPRAMGACIVSGLNNWHRVALHREGWRREHPLAAQSAWADEFRRLAAKKHLYQDRFIILSTGPYSAVAAPEAVMSDAEWCARSIVIRREHECTHYFTQRMFGSMRNNVLDELIADFVGLVRAFGRYDAGLALRFLGLEEFPAIRVESRIQIYRGDLSDEALAVVASMAVAASRNLQELSERYAGRLDDLSALAGLVYALYALTLEELAMPTVPALAAARWA